jgi:lysophospholipase L1-like esterase
MSKENRKNDSIIILGVTILLLSLLSYFQKKDIQIGSFTIKKVELFKDIFVTKKGNLQTGTIADTSVTVAKATTVDDSKNNLILNNSDTAHCLASFFTALMHNKAENKITRIAYFGDSQIEGDLMTQTLRLLLQSNFGGEGVGMMPITSGVSQFRGSITHVFSNNWDNYSFIKPSKDHLLGLTGYVFRPGLSEPDKGTSESNDSVCWASYIFSNRYTRSKYFSNIKLFYSKAVPNARVTVVENDSIVSKELNGTALVNELALSSRPSKRIKLKMNARMPVDLFGVSFESNNGVILDNYSFRGISGLNLLSLRSTVLKEFNSYLDYKLIVLQYGLNVAAPNAVNFEFYDKGMTAVIKHFQECFPNASILLVGVGDRSFNNDGVLETQPSIPILIDAQKNAAKKCKVAFWNLFDAMGGTNAMLYWVDSLHFANKDYTHLNFKGSNKIAHKLYKDIMSEYAVYCKSKKH